MTHQPTVALVVSTIEDEYENNLLRGVQAVLQAAGVQVLCVVSGGLNIPYQPNAHGNILHRLLQPPLVDALILSGALRHSTSPDGLKQFWQQLPPIPMVGIALDELDIPYLMAEGYQGMYTAVTHLIVHHKRRALLFLRGPVGQKEAEERFRAYRDALRDQGVPYDPTLVIEGDYSYPSGQQAMAAYLMTGHPFDAVVCANDTMALAVLQVLRQQGVQVPQDVSIVGFDDSEGGRYENPPLTTVRQSSYEQGQQVAGLVLALLAGEPVPAYTPARTRLVLRRSCGCGERDVAESMYASVKRPYVAGPLAAQQPIITAALSEALGHFPQENAQAWANLLFTGLLAETEGECGRFLGSLDQVLQQASNFEGDVAIWNQALSVLREWSLPWLEGALLRELWPLARQQVGEHMERIQAMRRIATERRARLLRLFSDELIGCLTLPEVLKVVNRRLPDLGIRRAFIALYEQAEEPMTWARLVLAFTENGRVPLPGEGVRFWAPHLLPARLSPFATEQTVVVEALYTQEVQLGFAVFTISPAESSVCDGLRTLISSSLRTLMLIETQRRMSDDIMTREKARREREALIRELEAKNAELERFTYTVSHDLKSPLITIRGFLGMLERDISAGNLAQVAHNIAHIRQAANTMQELLQDLLNLSRVGRVENAPAWIRFADLVQEAMQRVAAQIAERGVTIQVEPDLPMVYGDRLRLVEVLQNLLDNGVKFMGAQPHPHIEIGVRQEGTEQIFFVRDNGIGVEEAYHKKIFGLFERLNTEVEGTGIGLALVKRIVELHNGRIWVESTGSGQGSTFCFTLNSAPPVRAPQDTSSFP